FGELLNKNARTKAGMKNRHFDLEDEKTFAFSENVIEILIQKIIHIQKLLIAHATNVLRSHTFWGIIDIFLA
ncbi:MAG: hypothetical protein ACI4HI_13800, partial [Lachnospiraceae bacterium]